MAPRLRLSVKNKKVPSVSSNGEAVFGEYGAESRNGGRGPMHTSPSGEHGRHMLGRARAFGSDVLSCGPWRVRGLSERRHDPREFAPGAAPARDARRRNATRVMDD